MPDDDPRPTWVIHCDGSAVPNPGRMGLGAVVAGPGTQGPHRLSAATTCTGCNNEAELRALLLALRHIGPPPAGACVQVHSDSRVLVEQLAGGGAAPPVLRLAPLVDTVRALLQAFAWVELHWLPRHRNGAADALARAALGLAPKAALPAGARGQKHKNRKKHPARR